MFISAASTNQVGTYFRGGYNMCCCVGWCYYRKQILHIWCILKPCQTTNMRASTVLPPKSHPVVWSNNHSLVECIKEYVYAMVEEPVSNGWVLHKCLGATGTGLGGHQGRWDSCMHYVHVKVLCTSWLYYIYVLFISVCTSYMYFCVYYLYVPVVCSSVSYSRSEVGTSCMY